MLKKSGIIYCRQRRINVAINFAGESAVSCNEVANQLNVQRFNAYIWS